MRNKVSAIALSIIIGFTGSIATIQATAANASTNTAETQVNTQKTKRVPTMRNKVYEQLARAQSLADEGKQQEALEALHKVNDKRSSMNAYEIAMMNNFYAFIYYGMEDMANAIVSFENVVAEDAIPDGLRQSTLYSLAQLSMAQEQYAKTVKYINEWMSVVPAKTNLTNAYILLAQAHYQLEQFEQALKPLQTAIDLAVESDETSPKENWFVLQRAIYYSLKNPAAVADVTETLVRLFNKPEYWIQLAGMYGELGWEDKQLSMMEVAHQQGFITKRADIIALSQLYVYHQVPVKGALLLEKAMSEGTVESDVKNLTFLAQAYTLAKEESKAIPVLAKAAGLSKDGNLDAQLGQTYLNLEQFEQAIAATQKAIKKGELKDLGKAQLVLGMAHFNLKQFDESLNALANAVAFPGSKAMATQWKKYVSREKAQAELLAKLSS